jgi:23S rRNA (uracil1939-C5)-methyltransferase
MAGAELLNARIRTGAVETPGIAEITDLSHEGRGIARVEGKAIFIDDALPGERVEWQRTKRSKNFDEGRLTRVVSPSPHRTSPRCAHFGVCGGCALQHLAPAQQLEFKQRQLLEALSRIGRVTPAAVLPALNADVWNYRRRARLAARWVPKKGRTVVGFRERSGSFIADLKQCEILAAPVHGLIEPLSLLITGLSVRARVPQIEVAIADNAVALVIRVLDSITQADRDSLETFELEHDVDIYLQPGGYDTVAALTPPAKVLEYRLPKFDIALQFEPTDFVQVNAGLNAQMVERAIAWLAPAANERVLDLFCGLGNFTLPLARSGAHVTAVEGESGLVARARANAARNGLSNVEFHVANLADSTSLDSPWANKPYDKILLDPPRAGAREVLPLIARSGARMVLYISCHPGSLARDAELLVHEYGFKLDAAGVMDMFPHTAHVESVGLFRREGDRG